MAGWIGVDLDGTLAHFDQWRGPDSIGLPIPAMVKRVESWVAEGREVRIFTARASDPRLIPPIKRWLKLHGLPDLRVTNVKDFQMIELWDDRAVQVIHNTGRAVQPKVLDEASRPDLIDVDAPEQPADTSDDCTDRELAPTPDEVEAFKRAVKARSAAVSSALLDALDAGEEYVPSAPTEAVEPAAIPVEPKVKVTLAAVRPAPEPVIESTAPAWADPIEVESFPPVAAPRSEPRADIDDVDDFSDLDDFSPNAATTAPRHTEHDDLPTGLLNIGHRTAFGSPDLPRLAIGDDDTDDGFPSLRIDRR